MYCHHVDKRMALHLIVSGVRTKPASSMKDAGLGLEFQLTKKVLTFPGGVAFQTSVQALKISIPGTNGISRGERFREWLQTEESSLS